MAMNALDAPYLLLTSFVASAWQSLKVAKMKVLFESGLRNCYLRRTYKPVLQQTPMI